MDDICQAVLARDEVVRYLSEPHGEDPAEAQRRVHAFLTELRTRQRYPLYKSLKYFAFPLILWRIKSIAEHAQIAQAASAAGRVIYASNHKSHTDYVIQPVLLDNHGIRAPIIAAGINLFGGPLGLLHRHVTGAIPIRRATKDPAYLITLKAYIAELLRHHDLLFYIEGGRSYSGELKAPKTGLIHAAMQAQTPGLVIVPMAISYDFVLEDRVLAAQVVKKRQRPFTHEFMEMVRSAIGFYTRAFVTFGDPIPTGAYDPASRTDVLNLANRTRDAIGRLYKVTPTAIVAAAMQPSLERAELEDRADQLFEQLHKAGANLAVTSGRQAVAEAVRPMQRRGILACQDGRYRVRNRLLLRYYARTIDHFVHTEAQAR